MYLLLLIPWQPLRVKVFWRCRMAFWLTIGMIYLIFTTNLERAPEGVGVLVRRKVKTSPRDFEKMEGWAQMNIELPSRPTPPPI